MKSILKVRNVFRVTLLFVLVIRIFFIKYMNFSFEVASYVILGIALLGTLIFEIIVYNKTHRK